VHRFAGGLALLAIISTGKAMASSTNPCAWLDLIDEALTSSRQATGLTLPPISAMDEALMWLSDPRVYDPQHKGSWRSCLEDLRESLSRFGHHLSATVSSPLATTISAIKDLPGKQPTSAQRQNAISAITQLKAELINASGLQAAWADLIDICRDSSSSITSITFSRQLLFELLDASGRNADEIFRAACRVLRDHALAVMEAQVVLGERPAPAWADWPQPLTAANLTEDERVQLAARLLTVSPTPRHHVVWLAFDRARIPSMILHADQLLSFYDCDWVRGNLEQGGPHLDDLPEEIRRETHTAQGLPTAEDVVLARVDLGVISDPDPASVARDIVRAVVDVAGVKTGFMTRNNWRSIGGHLHAVDGHMVGWSAFDLPEDDHHPREWREVIGGGLPQVPVELFGSLATRRSTIADAARALQWLNEAELVEPMTAIFLQVRVVESVASWVTAGTEKWYAYLDRYFRNVWIRDHIMDEIDHSVLAVVMGGFGPRPDVDPGHETGVQELRRRIVEMGPGLAIRTDTKQAADALGNLAAMFKPCSLRGKRIHTLKARLTSVATLAEWVDELGREWELGLRRFQRSRNSVGHSGPITEATARSIQSFSHQLACWSLAHVTEALLEGKDLKVDHELMAGEAQRWADGIRKHGTVMEALFAS
jgi:hypothetical protein